MDGLGGINKTDNGIVVGLLQLRSADISTPDDLNLAAGKIVSFIRDIKQRRPNIDVLVFPEYSLNGASKALSPELQCRIDGPQIDMLRDACRQANVWVCFSFMELNPDGKPSLMREDTFWPSSVRTELRPCVRKSRRPWPTAPTS